MKNKIYLKRSIGLATLLALLFFVLFGSLHVYEYRRYTENSNEKISAILEKVQETYPEITKAELVEILNSEAKSSSLMERYGVDVSKEAMVSENEEWLRLFLLADGFLFLLFAGALVAVFLWYNHRKDRELWKITKYIEEINRRNYKLEIDDMSEDELSILKNEIYKTTVMLKETAENSLTAKKNLKESLSDISHQLKTPLTSLLVILDNLLDDPEMEERVRQDFLRTMKREVSNINFLVQSLLKLSKFDADTISFIREEVNVRQIVDEAVQNVATLCDLKDVRIEVEGRLSEPLRCDLKWQVEAVTNILKNCVEHSEGGSVVKISIGKNQVYTSIAIRDYGKGMDIEEQKHIFERFYKGKGALPESVGIGLSLAKTIIESDGGSVSVESGDWGTRFTIKYFA